MLNPKRERRDYTLGFFPQGVAVAERGSGVKRMRMTSDLLTDSASFTAVIINKLI